eukprot:TRINITY_DN12172_c0_g1_i1.p1 TRINITY_DN12172_c0_g1~~TRINITY_DN12172_c0_g1_i1.p1  ORF type:complete len:803 (-),score=102.42 TRINITY_DN12172_c0_g1_i1:161-2569(-)
MGSFYRQVSTETGAEVPFEELLLQISRAKDNLPEPPVVTASPKVEWWRLDPPPWKATARPGRGLKPVRSYLPQQDMTLWDQARISCPTRGWPCGGGRSNLYDHQRRGKPAWHPTRVAKGRCFHPKYAGEPAADLICGAPRGSPGRAAVAVAADLSGSPPDPTRSGSGEDSGTSPTTAAGDECKGEEVSLEELKKQLALRFGAPTAAAAEEDIGGADGGPGYAVESKEEDADRTSLLAARLNTELPGGPGLVLKLLKENLAQVIDLFRSCDWEGSGRVDRTEFYGAVVTLGCPAPREDVNQLFDHLDTERLGELPYNELHSALSTTGDNPPERTSQDASKSARRRSVTPERNRRSDNQAPGLRPASARSSRPASAGKLGRHGGSTEVVPSREGELPGPRRPASASSIRSRVGPASARSSRPASASRVEQNGACVDTLPSEGGALPSVPSRPASACSSRSRSRQASARSRPASADRLRHHSGSVEFILSEEGVPPSNPCRPSSASSVKSRLRSPSARSFRPASASKNRPEQQLEQNRSYSGSLERPSSANRSRPCSAARVRSTSPPVARGHVAQSRPGLASTIYSSYQALHGMSHADATQHPMQSRPCRPSSAPSQRIPAPPLTEDDTCMLNYQKSEQAGRANQWREQEKERTSRPSSARAVRPSSASTSGSNRITHGGSRDVSLFKPVPPPARKDRPASAPGGGGRRRPVSPESQHQFRSAAAALPRRLQKEQRHPRPPPPAAERGSGAAAPTPRRTGRRPGELLPTEKSLQDDRDVPFDQILDQISQAKEATCSFQKSHIGS